MFYCVCFAALFNVFFPPLKIEKFEKYKKKCVFVYIGTCVPWMAFETKFLTLYHL